MACRRRLRCSRADTFFIPCPPPLEVAPSVPGTEESSPTADGAGDTLELDEVAVVVVVAAVLVTGEVFFTGVPVPDFYSESIWWGQLLPS